MKRRKLADDNSVSRLRPEEGAMREMCCDFHTPIIFHEMNKNDVCCLSHDTSIEDHEGNRHYGEEQDNERVLPLR